MWAELAMSTAADTEILEFARTQGRAIVTLDADFHAMLSVTRSAAPSVVRIRIEGLNADAVTALVARTVESHATALQSGCMITVKRRKTTYRSLR